MEIKISNESTFPLDYHFRGKREMVRPLFNLLMKRLVKEIDFEYKIGKSYIGLIKTLVFAAIRIQTQKIIVEFVARKEFKSPRIFKTNRFQKARWAYFVDLKDPIDIDEELIHWIKESHE
jgi:hypothetical protein